MVCMKISAFQKAQGNEVVLKTDYSQLEDYDKIYLSKVFTDTPVPEEVFKKTNVYWGGTGFFWDKAEPLCPEVEHMMPDYHLYDEWIRLEISKGVNPKEFKEYTDYSIGFTTRGCFRKCGFCVNKKYDRAFIHSPLEEFVDHSRGKICLLDDNFLSIGNATKIIKQLKEYKKPVKFKQGLDIRLLTAEKCRELFSLQSDGEFTFAFDDIKDYELIKKQLKLIRCFTKKDNIRFYVLVAYKGTDVNDVEDMFKRIALLMEYRCLPYIQRYRSPEGAPYENSENRGVYIAVARWCNQPAFFKKLSFREFCEKDNARCKTKDSAAMRALKKFEADHPEIAKKYFDNRFGEVEV